MNTLKHKIISAKNTFAVIFVFTIMVFVGVLGTLAISSVQDVFAAINKQINYQGKLTNTSGAAVSDGTYNMEFKLYTVSSGGSPLWTETRTSGDKVQVTNGLFSVLLGEVSSLSGVDFNQTLYLGVNIGGTSTPAWDGEMTPRKKLGAVPAAIVAETLNGLYSSQFFRSDATNATSSGQAFLRVQQSGAGPIAEFIGSASTTVFTVTSGGNVGIGTSTPSSKLVVVGGSFFHGDMTMSGVIRVLAPDTTDGVALVQDWVSPGESGLYSTAGDGQIATYNESLRTYYYGEGALQINALNNEATLGYNLGIGTTTPSSKLSVAGDFNLTGALRLGGNAGTSGQLLQSTGSGLTWVSTSSLASGLNYLRLENGGLATATSTDYIKAAYFTATSTTATSTFAGGLSAASSLYVLQNGNVGIGTSSPFVKFVVSGDSYLSGQLTAMSYVNIRSNTVNHGLSLGIDYLDAGEAGLYGESGDERIASYNPSLGKFYYGNGLFQVDIGTNLSFINGTSLGIGTTTPSSLLSVAGDFNLTGALRLGGNAGTSGQLLQSTGSGLTWVSTSSLASGLNYLRLENGGLATATSTDYIKAAYFTATSTTATSTFAGGLSAASSLYVLQNGNVGVGTGAPETQLHIATDAANPTLRISTVSSTSFDPTIELFRSNGSSIGGKLWLDNSTGDMYLDNVWNNNAGDIYFRTKTLGTPVNALSILGTGNVGIGTTTPSSLLSVAGDLNLTGAIRTNGDAGTTGMILQTTGTGVQWVATSSLGISGGGSPNYLVLENGGLATATSTNYLKAAYFTATSTTATSTFAGIVGIGTTSPSSAKLAIQSSGTSLAAGLRVNNSFTGSGVDAFGGHFVSTLVSGGGGFSYGIYAEATNSGDPDGSYGVYGFAKGISPRAGVFGRTDGSGYGLYGYSSSSDANSGALKLEQINSQGFSLYALGGKNYFQNNVGIGTTTPATKLSVVGDVNITATTTTAVLNATNFWDNRRFTTLNDLYETRSFGRFTLQDYYVATSTTDLSASIATGISGATYNPTDNTVFMVNNNAAAIYEFTLDGGLLRTITLTNFADAEAMTWMYDDVYAIGDENTSTITILRIASTTTSLNRLAAGNVSIDISGTITTGTNDGIEGLSYDSDRDVFYVIEEKSSPNIYKVTRAGVATSLFNLSTLLTSVSMTDASEVYFDRNSQNLFITSDEGAGGDKILQVNLQGTLISQLAAPTGFGQIEGIGFTPDGQNMFLSGENDTYARYEFARGNNLFALKSSTSADSGKVGIGTSSPVTTLTVRGSGGFDPFLIASSSNATMMIVSRTGNVGIGTSTPSSLLSVAGDINLTGAIRANGNAGTAGMVLQTTGTGVQWVATSSLGISGGGGGGSGTVNSGLIGQIAFYDASGTTVSGTSTLFISGEKIGVGTTTPSEKLVVVGTSTMSVLNATRYTDGYRHLSLAQLYRDTEYAKFTQLNIRQATTTPHPPLNYYLATSSTSFAGLADISGVKYYGKNNTLMFNRNTNGTQRVYEFTLDGRLLRTITLVGFPDPEALDWMYDDWFVIGDENTVGADAGSKITIIQIPDGVTTITRSNGTVIDMSGTIPIDNSSIEGVAYDPIRDVFYVAEEGAGTDANIYQVTRSGVVSTIWNPDTTTMTNLNIGDFSDLYYDKNTEHLFIAVDQCYNQANGGVGCDQVVEIDLAGNVIDRIFAPNGFTQLEGIGFSPDGESMFMAGEVSMFAWYKFQDRHDKLFAYQFSSSTPLTLGIGTTTPSTSLVVQGRAGVDVLTIASSTGASFMTIAQTGRIGFGTTTPSAFFAMTSTAGSFDVLNIASSSGSSMLRLSATGALSLNNDPGTSGYVLMSQGTSTAPVWVATSSLGISGGGGGGSGTVNSGILGQVAFYGANGTTVSGTSTLFITGENIGIGTTTPSSKLVVVGTSTMDYLVVGGGTPLANSIAHFGANVNSFAQVNVQNRNSGASASSDFVATADDGNDSRYYIDFGINSSGYNNPSYSITGARDGYLYTSDGALAVGTGSSTNANAALKFHTGGTQAANERMRITATGDVGIGTTSPMTDLDVFGSMVLSALNSYLNFGNATGTVGYGFRDNAGTIQVKNEGGAWVNIPTSGTTQWTDSGSDIFFNTGNVGIGTSSPAEKLQVAGNILIGKRTDSAGAWTLKSQSTPGTIASAGTSGIGTTTAMAVYNGSLYVGTMKAGAAEIYRHNGGTSWTKVSSSTAGVISEDAGATSAIDSVSSMAVYNGLLYVGTAKTGGAEVYQYNGNSTWTLISSTTAGAIGGAATTTAINSVSAMVVHQGQLIIGTSKASGAEIYRYDVGVNNHNQRWLKLSHPQNAGTIGATTAVNGVTALLSHNGFLYVGITKANGADVYRMDAPNPTNTFTRINAAAGSFTVATALDNVRTLAVFNGSIFAGVDDGAGTARVVRWNGNYTAGTVWVGVSSTTAGVIAEDGGSQTGIDRVMSMSVYKNDLYIGTADSTGIGQVYKYDVGNTWSIVSSSTAGVIPTTGSGHNSGISGVTAMTVYNDDLWIGTEEAASAEVYSFNSVEGESNKLRFEAQSDNADGIQNALGNFGEIQFLAEENGRNVNGNMNTGVFSFSHGINTAVGAYDLAEDYPTRDDTLTPGDLVSLDIREKGFVRKAQGKNDRDIIGIYSVDPALRLSQKGPLIDGARAVPIALAGRVPVTVTLENGPIKIGDYLTSSLEPGKAAKANRPGRVVGRALGNYSGLEGEEAKVTVFLGLESIDWSDIQSAQKDVEELADSTAPADAGVVAEFVDTVNTAAEDLVFALLNKADNVSVVITNQFTTLFASIQELFVRTLAILPGGSFIVPSGENQISGTATMPAGATDVLIPNEQVDEQSIVYISPTSAIDAPLYVARKVKGKGFHVRLKEPFNEDITFDWFFIKTYIPKNTQGNEVNAIVNQATSTDPGQAGTTTITIVSPDAGGISSQAETTPIDEVSSGDVESSEGTTTSEGEASEDSENNTSEDAPNEPASDQQDQPNQDDNSNSDESGSDTGTTPEAPVQTTPEPQAPTPTPSPDPVPSE